jgi:hypothetical protein
MELGELERRLTGLFGGMAEEEREAAQTDDSSLSRAMMEPDILAYVTGGTGFTPKDIVAIASTQEGSGELSRIYLTTRGAMEMIESGLDSRYDSLAQAAAVPTRAYWMLTPQLFDLKREFESYMPVFRYIDLGGENPQGQKRILVLYEIPPLPSFPYT